MLAGRQEVTEESDCDGGEIFDKQKNMVAMKKIFQKTIVLFLGLLLVSTNADLFAQQLSAGQQQEAQKRLQTMSPDEIDAKIKSLGMTREEAEKRAKENGIDLQSYIQGSESGTPAITPIVQSGPIADSPSEQNVLSKEQRDQSKPDKPVLSATGLPYFGYEIFSTTPAAFEPTASGPVDADYQIGPEDVLRVNIWGQVEQQTEAEVDKDGRIFIPTAGPVVVSGLTLEQATKTLTKQLSRSFQGLTAKPPTVWLDVTLAKIRPKRVFIMGEVKNPGGYTVSSYANVFNSLFAVGGPTINGSLREVRLIRGNKIIARVDLYSYLTGADKNNDLRVQSNDIIYVPVRKNSISIKGAVRKPAVYELLPGESLKKLLEFSGGALPTAYMERVQVERIIPFKERVKKEFERKVMDIDFRDIISKNSDYAVVDGDVVTLYSILDEVKNYVSISGSVYKPGTYQLTDGLRLSDLIELADSLRPETYKVRGELIRTLPDDLTKITIPFDLQSSLMKTSEENILLQPKDEVIIHTVGISRILDQFVEIYGSVKKPGRYILTENMTLIDLLLLAGGYTEDTWTLKAEIARLDRGEKGDTLAHILFANLPNLYDTVAIQNFLFYEDARKADLNLKHRDQVFIRTDPNFHVQQLVTIEGEVSFPGIYAMVTHNDFLSDLIARSGGITSAAYLRGGSLQRGVDRLNVDFQKVMNSPKTSEDIVLHSGDKIHIPKKPNTVKMTGEIFNPGLLGFIEGNDLWDYIDRAGGLKDSAQYVLLVSPNGNVEKFSTGWFTGNSEVYDGSTVIVTKEPPPPPEKEGESVGQIIRDVFAIAASVLTVLVLAKQL